MKIVIFLFASFFSFGLIVAETVTGNQPETRASLAQLPVDEAPAMEITLDTLEITVSAHNPLIADL